MTMTTTRPKPSEKSLAFLADLTRDRDVIPGEDATTCLAKLTKWLATGPTQKEVSAAIDRARAKPKRAAKPAATTTWAPYPAVPEAVPSSKFAILTELLHTAPEGWRRQEYLFFEVKKLRGRRVIRRLTGAPGRFNRTTLPAALATELFGHLEKEAFAYQAALTFGGIYSVCLRCGAELTDDLSRERKCGPICWGLMEPWRKAYEASGTV